MALRLRRDVQKASYYVWFLGAEEAKGLRGARVINSVLPYLIDRSRSQEPLKVTLQVSHKGIKILQGSSKHFIPHSAITSSVQTDDIVACVLLLYNPATKCPLHVHAYRCDSESTAEALHQQLQILINRPENQKRFEELETRLGILPPLPTTGNKSSSHINNKELQHSQKQQQPHHYLSQQQQKQQRRNEESPKRFSSSLGSDTGNSTRESECSEEHSGGSPISRSPPHLSAASTVKPLPQPNNELFDSLAAELRAKLNGNGPPLLLPPRDYDTVHRSKGNLTAIELRRCRNSLIVGGATPTHTTMATTTTPPATAAVAQTVAAAPNVKQVSSRGSSGIGSDLAPSPERQELNSSSDDEQWSNEADNSVIALKPSQIPIERSPPIIPHHPQLNRKSAVQPPDDSYLRDLPAKPYNPRNNINNGRDKIVTSNIVERDTRSKTPSTSTPWSREDEIKPIIMRPADYDAKFNRVLQAEQKQDYHRRGGGSSGEALIGSKEHAKLRDTDKYNEINRLLNKKLSLERDPEPKRYNKHKGVDVEPDDFDDSDPASDHVAPPTHASSSYHKENLTDKQKFMEYSSSKKPSTKPYVVADEAPPRYGGRHRYVDPADLPFEQPAPVARNKYAAVHRGTQSPERSDLGHRDAPRQRSPDRERERERDRKHISHSNERNPYREKESIPYIQSIEKMMKSSAMRYKSFDGITAEPTAILLKDDAHTKVNQRSKSYPKNEEFNYARGRPDYAASASSNITPKEKLHAIDRSGSRYDLTDEKDGSDYKPRRRCGSIEPVDSHARVYEDWSDEERFGARDRSPPPPAHSRSRSRSRDHLWESNAMPMRERDVLPHREPQQHSQNREREPPRNYRDYGPREIAPREIIPREMRSHEMTPRETRPHEMKPREIRQHEMTPREMRQREPSNKREQPHSRDVHDSRDASYRPRARETSRDLQREHDHMPIERHREQSHEYVRERGAPRRDYSPDMHSGSGMDHRSGRRTMEKPHQQQHPDMYPSPTPPPGNGAPIVNSKSISNLNKGYRHSYAEPVFARSGGRVGLAAVNPF